MRWFIALMLWVSPVLADTVLAARTLRAGTLISADDLAVRAGTAPVGGLNAPDDAIGREARVTLYSGRPVLAADLTDPAAIERNDLVTIVFRRNGLEIRAEGRALGRAAAGEGLRVMNIDSRTAISTIVIAPGFVSAP